MQNSSTGTSCKSKFPDRGLKKAIPQNASRRVPSRVASANGTHLLEREPETDWSALQPLSKNQPLQQLKSVVCKLQEKKFFVAHLVAIQPFRDLD